MRRKRKRKAKLNSVEANINLGPVGGVKGTWVVDEAQREAAWEMYVELVTRISVMELPPAEGLLREALSSLYTIFGTTREILRKYGPSVADAKGEDGISFGLLSVGVLNKVLRPFLTKWHPELLNYENTKVEGVSPLEHERSWEMYDKLRSDLGGVRNTLVVYADLLAKVSGVTQIYNS